MNDEEPKYKEAHLAHAKFHGFAEAHTITAFVAAREVADKVSDPCLADVVSDMLTEHDLSDPVTIQCLLSHAVSVEVPGALELWEKLFGPIPNDTAPTPVDRGAN